MVGVIFIFYHEIKEITIINDDVLYNNPMKRYKTYFIS